MLKTKMNSTAVKRTWIEWKAPGKAPIKTETMGRERSPMMCLQVVQQQNDKEKSQRKSFKRSIQQQKSSPSKCCKKESLRRTAQPKPRLKKHPEQTKEQNLVLTETEPQRKGPHTMEPISTNSNRNRTTKQRTHTLRSQPKY